ncbi:MAG: glycosyltransferase, partial [Spirochaetaceae bacterium]|nr:glycosyltransferase [Spirochaetaceae bacterium]
FRDITADYSIFDEQPRLSGPFYFSLGSLSKRKNLNWIAGYAAKHPDDLFAVSGSVLPTAQDGETRQSAPQNIMLLDYLPDARVKALMERCKAFILPSYYEGFGLTPLEALGCGARVIVSNAASLPEIYGGAAHYIDPASVDVDLDSLLSQPVADPAPLLKKYSYDASAKQVYNIIRDVYVI